MRLTMRSISGSFIAKLLKSLVSIQFNENFISAEISSIQFYGNSKFARTFFFNLSDALGKFILVWVDKIYFHIPNTQMKNNPT